MTADGFRKLALALPEAIESSHMSHPDFRVGGRIFASIHPDDTTAMVKLPPDAQEMFMSAAPAIFSPASGAWGRQGCTLVDLKIAKTAIVRDALTAAWENVKKKKKGR